MSFSWSSLNPANWYKDLTGAGNALAHDAGSALIQLLHLFMSVFAFIVEEIMYAASLAIYGVLLVIFDIADIAGPFALPAFLIMMAAFAIAGQIVFDTVRDIPVLGAFT
jgi:hypothetical protein